MTVFWVVVGSLIGAALLFVIPPLFKKSRKTVEVDREAVNISIYKNQLKDLESDLAAGDVSQEQYDSSRQEIERRLLEDAEDARQEGMAKADHKGLMVATSVVLAVALPVFAVTMYFNIGNLEGLNPEQASLVQEASPHGNSEAEMAQQIEQMIGSLAQRLQKDPSDIEGWVMLGRSFTVIGRYDDAVMAFGKAYQFAGDDPNVLTDYADALAMANGESLEGQPMELLERALQVDPVNQKALWLLGTAYFERGDFTGAIEYYNRLLKAVPPNSEDADVMRANIKEALTYQKRKERGEFGELAPSTGSAAAIAEAEAAVAGVAAPVAARAEVSGRVSLSDELRDKVAPTDTLFIFARAVDGPPMPLAIIRTQVSDLPRDFSLDESMAMMPSMSMANFAEVVVGARISKAGDAMPQSGDLQGLSQPVAIGTSGLVLTIDSVVP